MVTKECITVTEADTKIAEEIEDVILNGGALVDEIIAEYVEKKIKPLRDELEKVEKYTAWHMRCGPGYESLVSTLSLTNSYKPDSLV